MGLDGKIALVTRGATGIGFAIAQSLIQAGTKVVITGRREAMLKEACKELGGTAYYEVNDITDLETIPFLVQKIESDIDAIDIPVNNAGINELNPVTGFRFIAIWNTN